MSLPTQKINSHRIGVAAAFAAGIVLTGTSLSAQSTVYWDTNGSTPGIGGTGTWDQGTTPNWNDAEAGTNPTNVWSAGDYAIFGGTPGTVSVSGAVNVGMQGQSGDNMPGLTFTSGGYTLNGDTIQITDSWNNNSSINALVFTGGSGDVTINNNLDLISSRASGTGMAIQNSTGNALTIGGNVDIAGSTGQNRYFDLFQNNASGSIIYSGNTSASGNEQAILRVGYIIGSENDATYYINGNNSGLRTSNGVDLTQGIVYVGNNNAFGTSNVRLGNSTTSSDRIQVLTNGNYTLSNRFDLTGDVNATRVLGGGTADESEYTGDVSWVGNNGVDVRLTAAAGGRVTFSGKVDDGSATGSMTKVGDGTVVLTSNSNNLDLGVTVSEGVLLLNNTSGSGTGAGAVLVEGGATLGGTGSVGALVTADAAGSRFAAGDTDAIGTFTMNGGFAANSGATFAYDIDGASIDSIDFSSAAVALGGDITFDFTNLGTVETGVVYSLLAGNGAWTDNGANFIFNSPTGYALDGSYGGGDGFIWDAAGNSLTVQFTAIPEPSVTGLAAAGVAGLLVMMRRGRRKSNK